MNAPRFSTVHGALQRRRRRSLCERGALLCCTLMAAALGLNAAPVGSPPAGVASAASTPHDSLPGQTSFESPDRAVATLIAAIRAGNMGQLGNILGPGSMPLIESGDAIADRAARARFVQSYDAAHHIERRGPNTAVLVVGNEDWPLPIPIVRGARRWRFDAQAGAREILDRRIGRNELAVIEVCREYVKAQREYAAIRARGARPGAKPEYAPHIMSRNGRRDGLYWPATPGEPESPLGPLIAQARAEGYQPGAQGTAQPYHGYVFRILTRQGSHAPGGAKSYVVDGRMSGGFGLLAYPAAYGDSGVMTFIVNQDGIVFERNLGPDTPTLARLITAYDPDASWRAP
jgi:Protein of unknown function (DUF2950)